MALPVRDMVRTEDRVHAAEAAPQDHLRAVQRRETTLGVKNTGTRRELFGIGQLHHPRGIEAQLVCRVAPQVMIRHE